MCAPRAEATASCSAGAWSAGHTGEGDKETEDRECSPAHQAGRDARKCREAGRHLTGPPLHDRRRDSVTVMCGWLRARQASARLCARPRSPRAGGQVQGPQRPYVVEERTWRGWKGSSTRSCAIASTMHHSEHGQNFDPMGTKTGEASSGTQQTLTNPRDTSRAAWTSGSSSTSESWASATSSYALSTRKSEIPGVG